MDDSVIFVVVIVVVAVVIAVPYGRKFLCFQPSLA